MTERDALVKEIHQAGKVANCELRTRDKYGNIHWLLTSASLIIAMGESYLLTQSIDMTDRKFAEEALKTANKQLQDIIDFLPDATLIVDKNNKIIAWNRAIEEMTGIPKATIIGQDHYQASIPFYGEVRPFLMDLVGMNDTELTTKYSNVKRIGSVVHAEVFTPSLYCNRGACVFAVASPLLDDAGNIVGRIELIRDITERKRMEDELRQSEERYRTILDEMEEGYQETDLNGNYTFFNDAFLQIIGYTKEEMIGMNFSRLSADDEETKKVIQVYKDIRRGSTINRNLKWHIIRKDGSRRTCEFFASLLKDANGLTIGFRGICRDITEIKRAAEKLRKSEELYTTLVNAIPDIIIHSDLEGNILFVNDKALQVGGYSREEMVGHPLDSFVAPSYREEALRNKQLMLDNKAGHREYNMLTKDGREIPFDVNGDVLRDDKGMPIGFVNVCRDISERKRTEKLLRERDEHLRAITENLPCLIFQFCAKDSGEYGINYISDPMDEISKLIVGDDTPDLDTFFSSLVSHVHPDDRDRLLSSIKTAVETGTPWNYEGRVVLKSGEIIWFQGMSTPTRLGNRIVFNGILLNITERRLAEESLHKAEEKFRNIFMTSPSSMSITRLSDGLILGVNVAFEEATGLNRQDVIGKKADASFSGFWVDQSDRDSMLEELKSGRDIINHELKFRRKDGAERFGVYSARTIDIDGDDCIIFIMQDITGQKRMERDLMESNKMRLISQISLGVAHEVRNPLHAIQAISEAMTIDMGKNSIYEDYLMHTKAQVKRLSHLMKDLLELGKPIHSSQFDVASLTDIALASLEYWREAHPHLSQQIRIVDNLQTDNIVFVDTNKIQQVIINLMDNAVKHSSRDEEMVLEFDKAPDNDLMVMIIDKGAGIKFQDLPRVFEPFFTTSKGGTGLGLSICKHIVESHGGSIGIVNNQNMPGCTAWFTLPVHDKKEHK